MITNQGNIERVGRVALGAALIYLSFAGPKTAWDLLGLVLLVTGLLGWCPLYQLFGVSTCPPSKSVKGS